jgi:cytochrome c oxidase assembly factor CtaG
MDPVTRAVLLSWNWRLEVLIPLIVLGYLYAAGWWRLRKRTADSRRLRKTSRQPLSATWRLISYETGLVFIALSLLSPIDSLSQQLFFMHMIQHLLLIMIAPPLLLIANPMPVVLWGLPYKWRIEAGHNLGHLLHHDSQFRQFLRTITAPGIIWLVWIIALFGWHDPNMYNAALRYEFLHDLEHLSFFIASLLFWWHVTGAGPRIHKQFGYIGRTAFVIAAVPANMALGIWLAFNSNVIYTYYEAVPRIWGIDALTDQRIGGVIMWIPGSMMFLLAALILAALYLGGEENKPPIPVNIWTEEESLVAPGMEKQTG